MFFAPYYHAVGNESYLQSKESELNDISGIEVENQEYSLINLCVENEESLMISEIVKQRKNASDAYQSEKSEGKFCCLQSQLCATIPANKHHGESFVHSLYTPFGVVYILFRYFKSSDRYIRFVYGAGKYLDLLKRLDKKYASQEQKAEIYKTILEYLTSAPSMYNAWEHRSIVKLNDKDLAYFCAILAVCDPCYGKGENGGKDIRTVLRSNECLRGCNFNKFLDTFFYPLSQRRAYAIHREYYGRKLKRSLTGTKRGIKHITSNFSPCKPKSSSKLNGTLSMNKLYFKGDTNLE